jgi:putative heme-binding domain-containing protein
VQRPAALQTFTPALKRNGAPGRGREIFNARCLSCHFAGDGFSLGTSLVEAKSMGKEAILKAILEPHQSIAPGVGTVAIETKSGENLVGMLLRETALTIHLRGGNGEQFVVPKSNVGAVRPQFWSLMPDELEHGFNTSDMADLLEFVSQIPWPGTPPLR